MTFTVAAPPVTSRAAARAFTDEHIVPFAEDWDQRGAIPEDLLARLSRAGLWAPFLPASLGGAGIDMVTLGEIHEEIGRGCSSVRSLLTVHTMLSWAVLRWGSPAQRQRWGADLAAGRVLGAFCLSEPGAGSDTSAITTAALPSGDGWRLDGVKTWITGGQRADLFLVFARGPAATVALLVPAAAPGVSVRPVHDMLGTRASMLAEITFRDVALGPDALLARPGSPPAWS